MVEEVGEGGDEVGEGLAGSRLGGDDDVGAGLHRGDGAGLDAGGAVESETREGVHDVGVETLDVGEGRAGVVGRGVDDGARAGRVGGGRGGETGARTRGARNPRRALARAVRVNVGAETTREDVARDANNADDSRRADIATEGDAFAPP